jgi:ligand-binding sensor domain-containing protein
MKTRTALILSICILAIAFSVGCGAKKEPPRPSTLAFEFFNRTKGLPEENITSMAAFGGKVWAGSHKGLFCFDGVNWQIHQRKNTNVLGSDIIEDLKVADNALWIATDNGACKFTGTGWASVYTGGRARSVIGKGPELAVATAYGVVYSNGGAPKALGKENAGLVMDEVNQVQFDANGQLWVGTRAGMAKLASEMFQNFTGPAKSVMGSSLIDVPASPANCQLPGNNIKVIMPFKNSLAVGTTSGLSLTDMTVSYVNYKSQHRDWFQRAGQIVEDVVPANSPLPGNVINALAKSAGDEMLFIGTDKGLAILNGESWVEIEKVIPGLPKTGVNGLAFLNGDLWVGTAEGIYQIKKVSDLIIPVAAAAN